MNRTASARMATALVLLLLVGVPALGSVQVERMGFGEMTVSMTFEPSRFIVRQVGGYDYVETKDMVLIPEVGFPALPWEAVQMVIPWDRRVERIDIIRTEQVPLEGHYRIVPTQPPAALGSEPAQWVDGDPDIYNSDAYYPLSPVRDLAHGFAGENKILSFCICALKWNPASGSLILATRIEVRVTLIEDIRPRRLGRSIRAGTGQGVIPRLLESIVVNPQDIDDFAFPSAGPRRQPALLSAGQLESGYFEYVLITADSLVSSFEPLLEWKTQKGVPAKCVTREWIEANYTGSDSQDQIRNFLKDAYANWGTVWVVLAGDTAVVPCRYCKAMKIGWNWDLNKVPSDLYFSDLDGTWNADGDRRYGEVEDSIDMYPDVVLGRASVENSAEAQIFVQKVLTYEKNPPLDYLLDVLMAGEVMWYDPYTDAGIGLNMIDNDCIPPRFDPILKLYESLGNESYETVMAAMNQGQHFFFHDGHGSGHGLYVGWRYIDCIENEDVDTLTNSPRNFIMNSIACNPACIDFDCIGEHFLHSPEGGSVAFVGNSRAGWGCPGHPGYGYSDKFQHEFACQLFVEEAVNLGLVHDLSKIRYVPFARDANVFRYCEYQLLLLGDPEMPVWTDVPLALEVDYPDSIMMSGDVVTVIVRDQAEVVEGARVCLLDGADVYLWTITDASGAAVFTVSPASQDSLLLTVTAYNHLPFETKIGVSMGGKRLAWKDYEVVDDDDGLPGPGEAIGLRLSIKNYGDEAASGVSAVVRSIDGRCSVVESTATFGTVGPGEGIWSQDTLAIEFDDSLANGDVAALEIEITDDSLQTWVQCLTLVVAAPVVGLSSYGIEEIIGNGNWVVEPGEDILLTVQTANSGLAAACSTEALVTSLDPYFTAEDSVSLAGDIQPDGHGLSLHRIGISPGCPGQYVGPLEVELRIAGAEVACDTIYLNVGDLLFSDDCESGAGGWSHDGTLDLWHLSSLRSHSGSYSWYFGTDSTRCYPNNADGTLTSQPLIVGDMSALSFWSWYEVSAFGVDGVFVVVLRNGTPDTLDFVGSGGALEPSFLDTFETRSDWVRWEYSLDGVLPGDTIQITFGFVSDSDTIAEGVYLDDIQLASRTPEITGIDVAAGMPAAPGITVSENPALDCAVIMMAPLEKKLDIDVYDIRGRLVATLTKHAGLPSTTWDLKNRDHNRVAPGVYLLQARGLNPPRAHKLVVLR